MSTLLARVARFAFQRAWRVIAVWLVLLAAVIVPVAINGITITSDTSISGTESQDVLDPVDRTDGAEDRCDPSLGVDALAGRDAEDDAGLPAGTTEAVVD